MCDQAPAYPEFNGWKAVRALGGAGSPAETFEIVRDDGFGLPEHGVLRVLHFTAADPAAMPQLHDEVQSLLQQLHTLSAMAGVPGLMPCRDYAAKPRPAHDGWDVFLRAELAVPLESYLASHTYGEAEVIRLGIRICGVLEACSARGILHGAVKPRSLFVSGGNFEDALDFRLGCFGGGSAGDFAAPEVLCGAAPSAEADLYSLALVLYWMLNERRLPFVPLPPASVSGSDLAIARDMRLRGDPLPLPLHGSDALQDVVMRALSDRPADRFASPAELAHALQAVARPGTARPQPAAPRAAVPPPARSERAKREAEAERAAEKRRKILIGAGSGFLVLLLAVILLMALPRGGGSAHGLTLDCTHAELAPEETLQLAAALESGDPALLDSIEWESSRPEIASVEDGLVTGVAEGKARITARLKKETAVCAVTVKEEETEIESITLDRTSVTLTAGEKTVLTAKLTPADAPADGLVWASSDPEIARVKDGAVTAVAPGSTTVTATLGGRTAVCTVTVQPASEIRTVTAEPPELTLTLNGGSSTARFTVTGTGLAACEASVKVYALDSSVVQTGTPVRSGSGTDDTYTVPVSALKAGSTTVVFQISDASGTAYSAVCAVTVGEATHGITIPDLIPGLG